MKNKWKAVACKMFLFFAISLFSFKTYAQVTATDDQALVFVGKSNQIKVLSNDVLPAGCTLPTIAITTPPSKGTVTVAGDYVQYTPNTLGNDQFKYTVTCGGVTSEASVDLKIVPSADNISDAECVGLPKPTNWEIARTKKSTVPVYWCALPLAGPIYNQNEVHIVVSGSEKTTGTYHHVKTVVVLNSDLTLKEEFASCPHPGNSLAIADVDGDGKAEIFVVSGMLLDAEGRGRVYCYKLNAANKWVEKWRTATSFVSHAANSPYISPIIVDLNGDGIPEIISGERVFNAVTGGLIATLPAGDRAGNAANVISNNNARMFVPAVGDVDGDGFPEIVMGRSVYKVDVVAKTATKIASVESIAGTDDGLTALADIDLDGTLDVVVSTCSGAETKTFVWNVKTQSLIGSVQALAGSKLGSVPFIGDIDGDGYPEICVSTSRTVASGVNKGFLVAYRYDKDEINPLEKIKQKWLQNTSDESGMTALSLFDFNLDGTQELIYRDESHLRIIDGNTGTNRGTPLSCTSTTFAEHPIIVDIDRLGHACILVSEGTKVMGTGRIVRFDDPGNQWAPTRNVWNQFAYNGVNVNNDLTIPKMQLNPATVFPGEDGVLGTSKDVRPYNGYLQQSAILNKNGNPLFLLPNAQIVGNPGFNYIASADSMVITIQVSNTGNASFQNPFKISVHKNQIPGDKVYTYEHKKMIGVGKTETISFSIPKFKAQWTTNPFSGIHIRINDAGTGTNDQPVCNSLNVAYGTGAIIASDDRSLLFADKPNQIINVLDNDVLPSTCANPIIQILANPVFTGTATVNGTAINYTPAAGETADILRYSVHCGDASKADTATVYITLIKMPDNINDVECWIRPAKEKWKIKLDKKIGNVATTGSMVVGDLNNDGFPDIVAHGNKGRTTIKVFWGPEFTTHDEITVNANTDATLAIAKVKVSNAPSYESLIFYMKSDNTLRAIRPDGTSPWATNPNCRNAGMISFADFNNDGWTEVFVGNQIYDAATGKLLCDGGTGKNSGTTPLVTTNMSQTMAADILGDANLELIAGNKIYKVDINRVAPNPATALTEISSVTPPGTCLNDGVTVVADFDNDGKLDVLVRRKQNNLSGAQNIHLYLWSPHTGTSTGKILAQTTDVHQYFGVPFIGDIDGDGKVEIVTLGSNGVYEKQKGHKARRYDESTGSFELLWDINHMDQSGATGMTLFDFNNDGISEIVYRDENELRIMNASGKSHITGNDTITAEPVYVINSFQSYSETFLEYPIVADIYGNQSAAILVTSDLTGPRPTGYTGNATIDIYTSDPAKPWAPARKVWNQYAYNAVYVNEDLTIPISPLSQATVFPGDDGQLGTGDEVRPFNNFLQQQTILSKDGVPLFPAPNVSIELGSPAPLYAYYGNGDSLQVTLTINNTGDAELHNPVHITVYKDAVNAGSVKYTYAHLGAVAKGTSEVITFSVPNFTTWIKPTTNTTKLIVKINDSGNAKDDQPVCKPNNTTHDKLYSTLLLANNDNAYTMEKEPVTIDVLGNDSITTGCTPVITIVSSPNNGTVVLNSTNDSIVYTPNASYIGYDTISYQIKCGTETSTAKVFIIVYKKPDNIVDPGSCVVLMPKFDFKIKQQWQTTNAGNAQTGTLVGDLDGDGLPEIIAYNPEATAVNIYNGQSGVLLGSIKFTGGSFAATGGWTPHMTSILVDADKNGKAEIIGVNTATREIYSYEVNKIGGVFSLVEKWLAPRAFQNPFPADNLPHLNVADFNGDTIPELLIYNQIYNAVTGVYLGETEPMATAHKGCDPGRVAAYWNQSTNFQTTADFDGDGLPEIVAGGKIYKVHINPVTKALDSCTILKRHAGVPDGFTAVADIDMDGNLDVVVASTSGNAVSIYVWSPLTSWMTKKLVYTSTSNYPAHSFPFIGDIDGFVDGVTGKKHPEICLVTAKPVRTQGGNVIAYKYNSTTKALDQKWILGNSDRSGGTGITLFDFNNDGINELVYRDETHLRILNGVTDNAAPVLADGGAIFACGSATALEYPVIADTDGDGSANICVTCSEGYGVAPHYLRVYESASQPWAPTRKVWNQVNYEPLQINENLTVPKMSIPKNTEFAGKYPYNGALIQVPIVDKHFNPVILASDPATAGLKLEAINATTLRVWFEIQNNGDRFTNVNLPITLYHTDTVAANIIGTKPIGVSLAPGDKIKLFWDISSSLPYTKFIVRIQDDGIKYPANGSYLDCDYSNNIDSINVLLAVNDIRNTTVNTSLTIDVLANDFYGACGRNALTAFDTISNTGLHNGSLTINADKTFTYTPKTDKVGVDSVDYYIKCATDSSAARVYIMVHNPKAISYIACLPQKSVNGDPDLPTIVNLGFAPIPGVTYTWYSSKTGIIPVAGGVNKDTLTVEVKTAADFKSWWVEPESNGVKFERIEVVLSESTSCGDALSDCAKDGTVLFREDFKGNDPADPETKANGIPEVSATYIYSPVSGALLLGSEYAIVKNARGGGGVFNDWWKVNDHKNPGETRNGYMLQINANKDPGQYYERQLTGLCGGTKLFFSAWIINVLRHNGPDKVNARFLIEHNDVVIAEYTTGAILESKLNDSTDVKWRMYGFDFRVPNGIDNLKLRIINDGIGSIGNDFVMDDIEIRICTPPIVLNVSDTVVCRGTKLDIISTYDEDCTFGDNLTYRWEFKAKDSINWVNLKQENVIVDCNGASPANRLSSTWTINPAEYADEGYYRMLVSAQGSIDKVNCRASSDSIYVKVVGSGGIPDIRVQICPDVGAKLYLSSYLDTIGYNFGGWSKVTASSPNLVSTITGELNVAGLLGTHIYKYILKNQCGSNEANLYLHTVSKTFLDLPPDTVAVCRELELSSHLQLNQIMGIGVAGDWKFDNTVNPDNVVFDNVTKIVAPHVNAGAYMFNASKAWIDATDPAYLVTGGYRGDMNAKMFKIRYTTSPSCVGAIVKETVIIVTDILAP